ncbi:MAG: tRNA (adenosine(37)-N6)-dimethylallyltransferase MiaA [Bacilli bacterium]|nr:tRNA (adenosine(37)-N6)-dimethylallyltransferase MiaA [Bacilli bacterium]
MNKVIVILGPTAVGKTKLSVELAKKINGEIINADSTQVYKNLNIATAKITEEEKENIVHHLFDVKEINDDYTVYDYQKDVRKLIDDIKSRGKTPILVGGTGLYIKAALYDYEFDEEELIVSDYSKYSTDELYSILLKIDSETKIHKNNRKRIERTLDVYNSKGKLDKKTNKDILLYDSVFIGLTTSRELLYDRINLRVDKMLDAGLLEEAKWLYDTNVRTKAVMTPIGYKELFEYFEGNITKDEAIELIKKNSRRYAKRQYTWFNNQMNVNWFNVDFDNFNNTIDEVYNYIKQEQSDN